MYSRFSDIFKTKQNKKTTTTNERSYLFFLSPHAQLHPKYLNSNSTSHTWPFGAIAELVGESLLCFDDNKMSVRTCRSLPFRME